MTEATFDWRKAAEDELQYPVTAGQAALMHQRLVGIDPSGAARRRGQAIRFVTYVVLTAVIAAVAWFGFAPTSWN